MVTLVNKLNERLNYGMKNQNLPVTGLLSHSDKAFWESFKDNRSGVAKISRTNKPFKLLTILVCSILVADAFVMYILSLLPAFAPTVTILMDALFLSIALIPILCYLYYSMVRRAKSEDELLKFRLGIERSDEVIFMTDSEGEILYVNPAFEKTYGFCKEELAGKTPRVLKSGTEPDITYVNFWKTLKSNKVVSSEIQNKTKTGQIITVENSANPIVDENGAIIGFLAVQRDISERKRARQIQKVLFTISNAVIIYKEMEKLTDIIREQLGTLIDTSNFYIAFYDEATDMLTTTYDKDEKDEISAWPAEKSLTGYVIKQKKPLLLTRDIILELHRQNKIDIIGTIAEVWLGVPLAGDGNIIGALVVQSYKDANAYNMKDLDMLEFISNQIGISLQRKKTMLDLQSALVKAEESDRLKSAFLAMMNHELRTPLNHILGFSDLIKSGVNQEETKVFASTIQTSGKNLLAIIEDIFDLALVEQSQIKLRKQTFKLMDLFMENKISFDDTLRASGKDEHIKLIFKPDTRLLTRYITADRSKINQTLCNLFKNAVKFTDRGSIEFGCKMEDQSILTFYIKDTGVGIPKEKQAIIFDFFRQGDDSHTRHYGGLGIGLSISLKIARLLKGELTVKSYPGEGSTFCLSVPVEISTPDEQEKSTLIPEVFELNLEGRNILIVEDDLLSLAIVRSFLKATKAKIIEASEGREAIGLWHEHPEIDLVLMDLKMAGMDGFAATRILKAEKPELPIIALTAYSLNIDKSKALEAGCNWVITKPVSKQRLFTEIRNILNCR